MLLLITLQFLYADSYFIYWIKKCMPPPSMPSEPASLRIVQVNQKSPYKSNESIKWSFCLFLKCFAFLVPHRCHSCPSWISSPWLGKYPPARGNRSQRCQNLSACLQATLWGDYRTRQPYLGTACLGRFRSGQCQFVGPENPAGDGLFLLNCNFLRIIIPMVSWEGSQCYFVWHPLWTRCFTITKQRHQENL